MTRTYIILDGLADPYLGRVLSARWAQAGFRNAVDVAGQCAWLAPLEDPDASLTEAQLTRAAAIGRGVGVEIRDRLGKKFRPDNDLGALRRQSVHEYRARLATALMFGLPALALHYLAPVLASGSGLDPARMVFPWLFEMVLVGWLCVGAGFPLLWQAGLGVLHLRMTADVLSGVLIVGSFAPSAVGVMSMLVIDEPWFGRDGPMFHAAVWTMLITILGRWLCHLAASRLAGRGGIMLYHYSRVVVLWLIIMGVVAVLRDWRWALAIGLVLPPAISLGAINPFSPSWSMSFPVVSFAVLMLLGQRVFGLNIDGFEIETAAGFALIMTIVFALGWRRFEKTQ